MCESVCNCGNKSIHAGFYEVGSERCKNREVVIGKSNYNMLLRGFIGTRPFKRNFID